jgi:hypothetical protein
LSFPFTGAYKVPWGRAWSRAFCDLESQISKNSKWNMKLLTIVPNISNKIESSYFQNQQLKALGNLDWTRLFGTAPPWICLVHAWVDGWLSTTQRQPPSNIFKHCSSEMPPFKGLFIRYPLNLKQYYRPASPVSG